MRNSRVAGIYQEPDVCNKDGWYRTCSMCGQSKKLDTENFYKNGYDKEGFPKYRQNCKSCTNSIKKENRYKNKHSKFVGNTKKRTGELVEFTFDDWKNAIIFFGGDCAYCGATPRPGKTLVRDHLVAVNQGGKTEINNIIPVCTKCNCSKGDKEFKEWYLSRDFFSQERMNKIFKWRSMMTQLNRKDGTDGKL